jgi:hypothetical protein
LKSFSASSFAAEAGDALVLARAAVARNPQALFTDFQWYLYEGRDTVFFSAFSAASYTPESLANLVAEMVALAPQLTHGFVGAQPGQPFPKHLLDAITSVELVDDLDGYPDKWLGKSADIYERKDLPLFRVMAAVRRDGPDAQGRASVLQVRSSHALLEGSDSALLTRSALAAHGVQSDGGKKLPWRHRFASALRGYSVATLSILAGNILAPKEQPWGFRTLAIERDRLRKLANKLGVRQRSLMFALVTHALNGREKAISQKVIAAAYTMLDTSRNSSDDDFFRVRALEAKFPVVTDFVDFVRMVDDTVAGIEQKDITSFQVMINAMFGALRRINRVAPFLPGRRFWRFNGLTDIVLTLVPPHRTYGPMTHGMMEPIYCGAWHSAANMCTFCPGRLYVTLNFSVEARHLPNVDRIMPLLEEIEAREVTPHIMTPSVERLR